MDEERIKKEIEKLREKMEEEANRVGLNHQKVLAISRKIDQLHTKLIIIQKNKQDKQIKETTYIQKKKKDNLIKEEQCLIVRKIA